MQKPLLNLLFGIHIDAFNGRHSLKCEARCDVDDAHRDHPDWLCRRRQNRHWCVVRRRSFFRSTAVEPRRPRLSLRRRLRLCRRRRSGLWLVLGGQVRQRPTTTQVAAGRQPASLLDARRPRSLQGPPSARSTRVRRRLRRWSRRVAAAATTRRLRRQTAGATVPRRRQVAEKTRRRAIRRGMWRSVQQNVVSTTTNTVYS